jgi:hypothetical protein
MESSKDSIKYIRPVYTNTANGGSMDDRAFGEDPFNMDGSNNVQDANYRKAMYETTNDRYAEELANVLIHSASTDDVARVGKKDTALEDGKLYAIFGQVDALGSKSFSELGYIDGYGALFGAGGEKEPLAIQTKTGGNLATNGDWMVKAGVDLQVKKVAEGIYELTGAGASTVKMGYGRFNSESDFNGDHLGEVELQMSDYWFRPRPVVLGVTWSQLTELTMDTSFGVSAEEMLVDYAGQEIKKALDFRAVKIAYQAAKMNPAKYTVTFKADAGNDSDDSYLHTAQTFSQAVERVGDVMYNDINRGGVSRIVGGPAAISYLRLNSGFSTKGAQPRIGGHQVGELNGIPLFKVPSNVVPDDELVCIWKNDQNEADVSMAFGTLIPFFSTGTIQRKNLYKEGALGSYGDYNVLNKQYMGIIKITGLRQLAA